MTPKCILKALISGYCTEITTVEIIKRPKKKKKTYYKTQVERKWFIAVKIQNKIKFIKKLWTAED